MKRFITLSLAGCFAFVACSSDSDSSGGEHVHDVGSTLDVATAQDSGGDDSGASDDASDDVGTDNDVDESDVGPEDAGPADIAMDAVVIPDIGGHDAGTAIDTSFLDGLGDDAGPEDVGSDTDAPSLVTTAHTLTTSDGKSLAALLHQSSDAPANSPGVVLVHQFADTKAQWTGYVEDLTALGWRVLAFDLRGHGESDDQDGSFNGILSDPAQAPDDVKTAIDWLAADANVDATRVGIVGTSIGANLACVAMANDYGVKLSVAISPRQSAVESLADTTDLSFDSLYCAAAENDGGGAQKDTCNAFALVSGNPKATVIIEGSAVHGKTLLSTLPDEWAAIVSYLQTNL